MMLASLKIAIRIVTRISDDMPMYKIYLNKGNVD